MARSSVLLSLTFALMISAGGTLTAQVHHGVVTPEQLLVQLGGLSVHGPVVTDFQPRPDAATKTFNIVATQFSFTVSPMPFTVNQGDNVVLNVSVPESDGAKSGHGFLMDTYFMAGVSIGRGSSHIVSFVATTTGTFGYICTVSTCGTGHSNMFGQMTVSAVSNPAPTISSFGPMSGSTAGGTSVTIAGAHFQPGAGVKFGSVTAGSVNIVNDTTITVTAPPQAAGPVTIHVTNPDGQGASAGDFNYATPAPAITSVSPTTGFTSGGAAFTVKGSGFVGAATVSIGGIDVPSTHVTDDSTITGMTPLGPIDARVGTPQDVVVVNGDGTRVTAARAFTWTLPAPAVHNVSPAIGRPDGGTVVAISGEGFSAAVVPAVTFGGVPATSVTVANAVTLAVVAPAHATGIVDVVVHVGTAAVTMPGAFAFQPTPPRRRSAL